MKERALTIRRGDFRQILQGRRGCRGVKVEEVGASFAGISCGLEGVIGKDKRCTAAGDACSMRELKIYAIFSGRIEMHRRNDLPDCRQG